MSGAARFCTFKLEGQLYGLDVTDVQEVLRGQAPTRVPLAEPAVRGLINLRGQIVTAIDLRRRLDLRDPADDVRPMNLVVRTGDGPVSLLVDEIGDVVDVDPAAFEPPPERLTGAAREMLAGVYKLRDRLLLVLDTAKVCGVHAPVAGEA